jgi:hypothetical protein
VLPKVVEAVEMMAQIVQIILEDLVVRVVVHPIKIHQVLPVRVSLVKEMLVVPLLDHLVAILLVAAVVQEVEELQVLVAHLEE